MDEKKPLIIKEKQDEKSSIELPKNIWTLICGFLSLFQIIQLTRLNKKLYSYINNNNMLWKQLSQNLSILKNNKKDHLQYDFFNLMDNKGLPYEIGYWKEMKKHIYLKRFNYPKNVCEEKEKYIEKYCEYSNKKYMDKKTFQNLNRIDFCNQFIKYLIVNISALFVFLLFTLLEIKIMVEPKIKMVIVIVPLFLLTFMYFLYLFVYSTSKHKHYFTLKFNSFPHFIYFPVFSIFSLFTFFLLGSLKIDGILEINWNIIFPFLYLALSLVAIILLIIHFKERGNNLFFLFYFILFLFFFSFIILHLSLINLITSQYKWIFTLIPMMIFDICIIILFVFVCSSLDWFQRISRKILNISIILGFLAFISSFFLLFFYFLFSTFPILPFFLSMQLSLILLQIVAFQAITRMM